MPEGHTTEPNAKLKAVYRGHSHPATFMGGLFTATDDREQEYICCQADPDNLPDRYVVVPLQPEFNKAFRREQLSFWTYMTTAAQPGEWFTATQPRPGETMLLLHPQNKQIDRSSYMPAPPVPDHVTTEYISA